MNSFGNTLGDQDNGLKLLYKGYSWWTKSSNNLSLYEASIAKGDGNEANARHVTWKEVKKNVIKPEKIEVNCVTQLKNGTQWINKDFFPEHYDKIATPRYIFRYATTRQLAGTTAFESMDNINGIKDEYVYTKEYNITVGSRQKMDNTIVKQEDYLADGAISADEVKVGYYLCADGRFCQTLEDANENHNGAVAVVAYLGGDKRVESGADWNGLAMALKPTGGQQWGTSCNQLKKYSDIDKAIEDFTGIASTVQMATKCDGHRHDAAKACYEYDVTVRKRNGAFSSWFLPSLGQWKLAFEGLGGEYQNGIIGITDIWLEAYKLEEYFGRTKDPFWTATLYSDSEAYLFQIGKECKDNKVSMILFEKVFPFLAFKYDGGGTTNPEDVDEDF